MKPKDIIVGQKYGRVDSHSQSTYLGCKFNQGKKANNKFLIVIDCPEKGLIGNRVLFMASGLNKNTSFWKGFVKKD